MEEKSKQILSEGDKNYLLIQKKNKYPLFVRKVGFKWYNPLYAMWKLKRTVLPHNKIPYHDYDLPLSIDFINYCFNNNIAFDTDFFSNDDAEQLIINHIDNRIKTLLSFAPEVIEEEIIDCYAYNKKLQKSVKRKGGKFLLKWEGVDYCLSDEKYTMLMCKYHNGLIHLPETVKEKLVGKDFLDCGAFIGDSALVFLLYKPNEILAYEPVTKIYHDLCKTISFNKHLGSEKIIPLQKGVGDVSSIMQIGCKRDSTSTLLNKHYSENTKTQDIEIVTIDDECKNRNVGLIKMDIEGFEYNAVKGALETIKRDKPVLLISLYHTGKDFFEIPRLLKETVPEYTLTFIDIEPLKRIPEKILMAYIEC